MCKREIRTWDKGGKRILCSARARRLSIRFLSTPEAQTFFLSARRPLFDTNTNFLPHRGNERKKDKREEEAAVAAAAEAVLYRFFARDLLNLGMF